MTDDPRFLEPTPFSRLVATHAVSVCGDACVAASLAGSLFFQQPGSARGPILLYLLLTMAPFAIVAPVMGPALDRIRGGRRLMVVSSAIGRAMLCLAMAQFITRPSPAGLLIYPLAFGILVLAKTYSVARSALVPALIDDQGELVRANSKLAVISLIASLVGGGPAFAVQFLFGADWSLVLATFVFATAAVFATRIPRTNIVQAPEERKLEDQELHQPSIQLAGSAMAVGRAAVGFIVFFSAFAFKDDKIGLGVFAIAYGLGSLGGNVAAPLLRERVREETILAASMITTATFVVFGALMGGTMGFALSGLGVAVGAAAGRLGFDSLLQRDGPDAARGRAFARFETRFQLAWVLGALCGIIPATEQAGLFVLAAVLIFGGVSYVAALRAAHGRVYRTTIRPRVVDRLFDRAKGELSERREKSRGSRRTAPEDRRSDRSSRTERPDRSDPTQPGTRPAAKPSPKPPPRRPRRPSRTPGTSPDPDPFPGGS
jgi:hypothetical protein